MNDNLDILRRMKTDDTFHHATYRDIGSLWEGLYIYGNDVNGCRGFSLVCSFPKDSPDLAEAESLVRGSGVSVGAYGRG